MKKTKKMLFTIPNDIVDKLKQHSDDSLIPMSKLITKLLKDFFEKK